MTPEFVPFPKCGRLFKPVVITEKIDGTNAQVFIREIAEVFLTEDDPCLDIWWNDGKQFAMYAGSRTRWITPRQDHGQLRVRCVGRGEPRGASQVGRGAALR